MKHAGLALLAALLTLAAAPAPELPIPPVPPLHPPTDTVAPTPDGDLRDPLVIASGDPQVRLRLFRVQRYDTSRGFLPGSRFETSEERKAIQTPGVSVTVPLQ